MKKISITLLTVSIITMLDIITKEMVVSYVSPGDVIDLLPFLRIVNVKNTGAAFGMFASLGNTFFLVVTVLAIIFIIIYLSKLPKGLEFFALSLILGGAIGNFVDRATIGEVIDFIDIFVNNWHWPAFNIADSALTVGITLFIWSNIFGQKKDNTAHSE